VLRIRHLQRYQDPPVGDRGGRLSSHADGRGGEGAAGTRWLRRILATCMWEIGNPSGGVSPWMRLYPSEDSPRRAAEHTPPAQDRGQDVAGEGDDERPPTRSGHGSLSTFAALRVPCEGPYHQRMRGPSG